MEGERGVFYLDKVEGYSKAKIMCESRGIKKKSWVVGNGKERQQTMIERFWMPGLDFISLTGELQKERSEMNWSELI